MTGPVEEPAITEIEQKGKFMSESEINVPPHPEIVKLTESELARFWSHVNKTESCWLWTAGLFKGVYGCFKLRKKSRRAHRVSWLIHRGQIPDGMCVCHNCPGGDNPLCVNPDHLWLGADVDNVADRVKKGRTAHADGHGRRTKPERWFGKLAQKLTPEKVSEIRRLYADGGISQENLGKTFGVTQRAIATIIHRICWKHIP